MIILNKDSFLEKEIFSYYNEEIIFCSELNYEKIEEIIKNLKKEENLIIDYILIKNNNLLLNKLLNLPFFIIYNDNNFFYNKFENIEKIFLNK